MHFLHEEDTSSFTGNVECAVRQIDMRQTILAPVNKLKGLLLSKTIYLDMKQNK